MRSGLFAALFAATVVLRALNDSHENGTATLVPEGTRTRVAIVVPQEPPGAVQPANVHAGRCNSVEGIRYSLNPVRDGRSISTIAVPLYLLQASKFIVVVQDSPASLRAAKEYKYVSCGLL
jgi:hypothetical protein